MTIVRTISSRPPRRWQRHGWLTLGVTTSDGHTATIRIPSGNRAGITRHLNRRFGITDWKWA